MRKYMLLESRLVQPLQVVRDDAESACWPSIFYYTVFFPSRMSSDSRALMGPGRDCPLSSVPQSVRAPEGTLHQQLKLPSCPSSSAFCPENHALVVGLKISLSHVMACGTDKESTCSYKATRKQWDSCLHGRQWLFIPGFQNTETGKNERPNSCFFYFFFLLRKLW